MAELGIDIAKEFPKPLTTEAVQASDVVITMGCGDACPFFPGKRYLDWKLDDPAGQGPTRCDRSATGSTASCVSSWPSWWGPAGAGGAADPANRSCLLTCPDDDGVAVLHEDLIEAPTVRPPAVAGPFERTAAEVTLVDLDLVVLVPPMRSSSSGWPSSQDTPWPAPGGQVGGGRWGWRRESRHCTASLRTMGVGRSSPAST